ncbi:hypothetical protein I547_0949 [Mycobacterium kansasii 824]|nr:hypothetical protein I547_0949 [Mycobacterium kansasii 824]
MMVFAVEPAVVWASDDAGGVGCEAGCWGGRGCTDVIGGGADGRGC